MSKNQQKQETTGTDIQTMTLWAGKGVVKWKIKTKNNSINPKEITERKQTKQRTGEEIRNQISYVIFRALQRIFLCSLLSVIFFISDCSGWHIVSMWFSEVWISHLFSSFGSTVLPKPKDSYHSWNMRNSPPNKKLSKSNLFEYYRSPYSNFPLEIWWGLC